MRKKTIFVDLLAYTEKKGGTDFYIKSLYQNISSLECDLNFVGLASSESKGLDMSWFPGEFIHTRLKSENKTQWSIGELFVLPHLAKKFKPALMHCPANFGPFATQIPILLTVHDSLYWSQPQWAPNRLLVPGVRFLQKYAIKNAEKIITSTHSSAQEISSIHKIDLSKISVIYLAAIEKRTPQKDSAQTSPYILAGGNRFKHKNWEGLLDALKLIHPSVRPKLLITGGRSPDPLRPLVTDLGLENDVTLLDWVSDSEMTQLYSNASAVIIPSYTESYLPLFQALNFKKSLLVSCIPPHIEIAGDYAYYFDPSSPRSIANAIQSYLSDSQLQSKEPLTLGSHAISYSWQETASKTLNLMRSMIK